MAAITLIVAVWLGTMFVYSAALKLARYDRARNVVKPYRVLPPPVASAAGLLLPWFELSTGLLILFGWWFPLGPLLGAALGACFAAGSSMVLLRGDEVPCGCTGNAQERVTTATLSRALLIAGTSVTLLATGRSRGSVSLPFPVLGLLALLSILPALLGIQRDFRAARRERRQARHTRDEIVRLQAVLSAPAVGPEQGSPGHSSAWQSG